MLTFNTRSAAHLAARLHASDCSMVNMTRGRVVTLDTNVDEATVADLNERGFTVKECKCCR